MPGLLRSLCGLRGTGNLDHSGRPQTPRIEVAAVQLLRDGAAELRGAAGLQVCVLFLLALGVSGLATAFYRGTYWGFAAFVLAAGLGLLCGLLLAQRLFPSVFE